jgi:hypothetical protein
MRSNIAWETTFGRNNLGVGILTSLISMLVGPPNDAPAMFSGLVFLEGHFVTRSIVGRRLSLNAWAVFVAFAF